MQVKALEEGKAEVHERFEELGHMEKEMRGQEEEAEAVNNEVNFFFVLWLIPRNTDQLWYFQVDRLLESISQLEAELERVKEDR
jgi:hypothetical protein